MSAAGTDGFQYGARVDEMQVGSGEETRVSNGRRSSAPVFASRAVQAAFITHHATSGGEARFVEYRLVRFDGQSRRAGERQARPRTELDDLLPRTNRRREHQQQVARSRHGRRRSLARRGRSIASAATPAARRRRDMISGTRRRGRARRRRAGRCSGRRVGDRIGDRKILVATIAGTASTTMRRPPTSGVKSAMTPTACVVAVVEQP